MNPLFVSGSDNSRIANEKFPDFDNADYMCPPERDCYRAIDEDDFLDYFVGLAEGHHTLPAKRVVELDTHVASCRWCQREKKERTCPIVLQMFIQDSEDTLEF